MFFLLSKILAFLIKPVSWIFIFFFVGLFRLRKGKGKKALIFSFILFLFFTNPLLINIVYGWYEPDPVPVSRLSHYDVAIILGGFTHSGSKSPVGINFSDDADRLMSGLYLYEQGKAGKLLLTGGTSKVVGKKVLEAETARDFLLSLNFPATDLIIEKGSRNTYENAVNTASLLKRSYGNKRFLLITSAYHMPRAAGCFKKAGLKVTAFPVSYYSHNISAAPSDYLLPSATALIHWQILVKEWIGYIVYKIQGYI